MKKRICSVFLVLVAMIMVLSPAALAASSGGTKAAESRSGVVRLLVLGADGYYSTGSAFGVGEAGEETDIFITNHHVVNPSVTLDDGSSFEMEAISIWILKNDSAWNPVTGLDTSQAIPCTVLYDDGAFPDFAIIQAAEAPSDRVALPLLADESDLEAGDAIYALGYPALSDVLDVDTYGERLVADVEDVTITSGVVSRFTTSSTLNDSRIIQHDAQISSGNSGGPLLDENGAVVGINTYSATTEGGATYMSIRIQYAMDALDSLGIEYDVYKSGPSVAVIIAIIAGAVILVAAIITVVCVTSRKKKKQPEPVPAAVGAPVAAPAAAPTDTMPAAPAVGGTYRLQGVSGVFAGKRFAVVGQVRMGRDPQKNDLIYPAGTQGVSGVHCVVAEMNGQLYLKDLGSTYGTFVAGGQRLAANQATVLQVGDRFYLGSEREAFVIDVKGGA